MDHDAEQSSGQEVPVAVLSAPDGNLISTRVPADQGRDAAPASPTVSRASSVKDDERASSEFSEAPRAGRNSTQAPPRAHRGWNQGINGGLRTSFATSGKNKLRRPVSERSPDSPVQPSGRSVDVGSLRMPQVDAARLRSRRRSAWQATFVRWSVRLIALNKDRDALRDADVLREAWGSWLESQGLLSQATQEAAMQAAKSADLDTEKLESMVSRALASEPEGPWEDSPTEDEQTDSHRSESQTRAGQQPDGNDGASLEATDWTLPPPQSPSDFDELRQKDPRGWEEKFVEWCKSLSRLNDKKIKAETSRERNRVTESYVRWIHNIDGLSKAKAAAARRAAAHYARQNRKLLAGVFAGASPASSPETDESVSSPQEGSAPSAPSTAAEMPGDSSAELWPGVADPEFRERYFPGIRQDEAFCHTCASHGHDAAGCPEATCRFCGDPEHRSFSCQARLRCAKCKQLGHNAGDCAEKLSLPPEEVECAFCGSYDHVDASCHELWRSFLVFDPDRVRKVRSLPVYCYTCGRQGHYGPDCGLNPQRTKQGPWETWSQANCDRYLDPASPEVAIIFRASAGQAPPPERPDLGKSIVPKRHIFFEEADDDEDEAEDFIRPPVRKSARVGHITFSGNGVGSGRGERRPSTQYNGGNSRAGYTQPPLPPGPPPPIPPQGRQESRRNGGRRRGGGGR